MAHFAQLDKDNKVIQVVVIDNSVTYKADGTEDESLGVAFCQQLFGADTKWVATSYNANKRGIFAGIGDSYDAENDTFVNEIRGIEVIVTKPIEIETEPTA
jgi:hypothetical protein